MRGAIAADDPTFVRVRSDGPRLTLELRGRSPATLRRTVDDLLAGIAAAEATLAVTRSVGAGGRAARRPR